MAKIIVGVTGASGTILAWRAVDALAALGHRVELVMTKDASLTALIELGKEFATPHKFVESFSQEKRELITLHQAQDFSASIASGSYQVDGMLVIPCSMATLAACALGLSDNLVRRAADVTMKEKRPCVFVPREAPFSEIHLENMVKLARVGATIVPPIPAWYTKPQTMEDMENFIVGKALDALKIDHEIYPRWDGKGVYCEQKK